MFSERGVYSPNMWPTWFLWKTSGASFRREDLAPREPEFGVEFWDANFQFPIFCHGKTSWWTVDVSDIFFFSARGGGKGEFKAPGEGVDC